MSNKNKFYYYDEGVNRIRCYGYREFIKLIDMLQTKGQKLSLSDSQYLYNYRFIMDDGDLKNYYTWYKFFPKIEEDFGIPIDTMRSFAGVSNFSLFLKDKVRFDTENEKLVFVGSEEEITQLTPVVTPVELNEIDLSKPEEVISGEEFVFNDQSQVPAPVEVDYDFLKSLLDKEDKSGSKLKLETYVKDTYNIDLSRSKSFPNMILQLKEELG